MKEINFLHSFFLLISAYLNNFLIFFKIKILVQFVHNIYIHEKTLQPYWLKWLTFIFLHYYQLWCWWSLFGAFYCRGRFWPLNCSDSIESESEGLCFDSEDEELSVLDSACLGGEALAGIKGAPSFSCSSKSFFKYSPCCSMSTWRDFCTYSNQNKYIHISLQTN